MSRIPPEAAALIAQWSREPDMQHRAARPSRPDSGHRLSRLFGRRDTTAVASSAETAAKPAATAPRPGHPASI